MLQVQLILLLSIQKLEIENKIPDINNRAVNINATEIEVKIPDITNLVAKASLNTKVIEIENKIPDTTGFITTLEFNILTKIVGGKKKVEKKLTPIFVKLIFRRLLVKLATECTFKLNNSFLVAFIS